LRRRRGEGVTQVLQGEQRYDLVVRYQAPYRSTREAIENIRLVSPSGERVSLAQLAGVECSMAHRSLPGSQFALRGHQVQRARPRLGSTVEEAMSKVTRQVKLPTGYHIDWRASTRARSDRRSGS